MPKKQIYKENENVKEPFIPENGATEKLRLGHLSKTGALICIRGRYEKFHRPPGYGVSESWQST